MKLKHLLLLTVWAAFLTLSKSAFACSVCFGDPNSKSTQGIFAAVYLLLGVVVFVLGGIAFTAMSWAKRARSIAAQNGSF